MNNCFVAKNLLELQRLYQKKRDYQGFTLVEILIVIAIVGIMAGFAAPYINFGIDTLQDATRRVASNFRLVRTQAIAQTSAYRISQSSATQLKVERANSCFATTWVTDNSFTASDLSLTEASSVKGIAANEVIQIVAVTATVNGTAVNATTNWNFCYSSRGVTYNNQGQLIDLLMTLKSLKTNKQTQIEVFTGGAVQVYGS